MKQKTLIQSIICTCTKKYETAISELLWCHDYTLKKTKKNIDFMLAKHYIEMVLYMR